MTRRHDLYTQIFYLNRLFYLISDGYVMSGISIIKTNLNGDKNIPFTIIDDENKIHLKKELFEGQLKSLFQILLNHISQFTVAPKLFSNDFHHEILKQTVNETIENLIELGLKEERIIKTSKDLENDFQQVIEIIDIENKSKDVVFFETWFH